MQRYLENAQVYSVMAASAQRHYFVSSAKEWGKRLWQLFNRLFMLKTRREY